VPLYEKEEAQAFLIPQEVKKRKEEAPASTQGEKGKTRLLRRLEKKGKMPT